MTITIDQAKSLRIGDIIYHVVMKKSGYGNYDRKRNASPVWKVNGPVKLWKNDPTRIRIPLKHADHTYGELTNGTFEGGPYTLYLDGVDLTED